MDIPPSAPSSSPSLLVIATLGTGFLASIITLVFMAPELNRMLGMRPSPAAVQLALMSDAVGAYLTADATTLTVGDTTFLHPTCNNATSASLNQGLGSVPVNRTVERGIMPETTTTYTLTCSNPGLSPSTAQASVTVTVNPNTQFPNALSIYLSPDDSYVSPGQSTNIRAYCHNGTSMVIDHGIGTKTPPAVFSVSPSSETTYSATCYGATYPTDPNNYVGTTATIGVVLPDLYPSFSGPLAGYTATAGVVSTYSGAVFNLATDNYGVDPTISGSYRNLLQRADAVVAGVPVNVQDATTVAGGDMSGGYDYLSINYTFPAADAGTTRYLRVCADKSSGASTGSITESDETNNCSGWVAVTVGSGAPDLTAGDVTTPGATPPAAIAGVSTTLNAIVSNAGTAGSGSSFTSLLQKASDSSGTGATDIGTAVVSSIGSGATSTASFSYSFPGGDAGSTQYLRVCADKSSAGDAGTIAESNENNNCGAWTAVTVASANGIASCTPSPTTAAPNQPVTWTVIGGTPNSTFAWSVTGGTPNSASGISTTFTPTFASGGDYAPTVTLNPGTQNETSAACTPAHITGDPYTCAASITPVITASPGRLVAGNQSTISWSATGIAANTTCTITGPNVGGAGVNTTTTTVADSSCNIATGSSNSSTISNITTQSVYTITCGATSKQAIVNVLPKFKEF